MLENEEIIGNIKRFLQDGCGCSVGVKGGLCCQQFYKEVVLSSVNNCLGLTCAELDFVILANIQAVPKVEVIGKQRKERSRYSFLYQNLPICKDM